MYVNRVLEALSQIDVAAVEHLVHLLLSAASSRQTVFVVGNGGSATTAAHMAVDLGVGSQRRGASLRIMSLCDNSGNLTAIANDNSSDAVFSEQLRLLGQSNDVLIAISASGNSPNLLHCLAQARASGMQVVAITGFNGGQLMELSDLSIHVPTQVGDYGVAEDAHLVINHMVTERFREEYLKLRKEGN